MQWNICPRRLLLALVLSGLGMARLGVAAPERAGPPTPETASHHPLGTWVWLPVYVRDTEERRALLRFCKERGFDRVLLQIPFAGETDRIDYREDLGTFLGLAADAGLKVEALDGGPTSGQEDKRELTLRRLQAVLALHQAQGPGRGFSGLHYDIEPYLSQRWHDGEIRQVALETLATMQAVYRSVKDAAPGLTVAYDIPPWYDKYGEELNVEFNGQTKNFRAHIQDLSDYVGVMSYRRLPTGTNSVLDLSGAVIAYAEQTHKKFYLSLETIPLKNDPQITFYGTAPGALAHTIDALYSALKDSPAFGGVLVHDYDHLRPLFEAASIPPTQP